MSSQKNEAMNKSIMRYVPKDKTLCMTMALTSRLCIAVSVDTLGHSVFYVQLFSAMGFATTELTFSGLRRMCRRKEYGRIRQGTKKYKLDRRLALRKRMIEGVEKLEKDAEDGKAYSSGMRMAASNDNEKEYENNENSGETNGGTTKKAPPPNNTTDANQPTCLSRSEMRMAGSDRGDNENENNEITEDENARNGEATGRKRARRADKTTENNKRTAAVTCRCGGRDHKRISSKDCPWRGLCQEEITKKCGEKIVIDAEIMRKRNEAGGDPTQFCGVDPTNGNSLLELVSTLDRTANPTVQNRRTNPTANPASGSEEQVQSTTICLPSASENIVHSTSK